MTAGLVIVQSAASGVDLACGVLLLHAVSMHVTAFETTPTVSLEPKHKTH